MLQKIPTQRPGITVSALTAWLKDNDHPVSNRTVERDLKELSRIFFIRCNDESTPYGWYWAAGTKVDFPSVELCDAASLILAEAVLKRSLPPAMTTALQVKFEQAHKKLSALEQHPYARWSAKVRYLPDSLALHPPTIKPEVLDAAYRALLSEKQLEATYTPFMGQDKSYILHPLALIHRGSTSYLVATAFDYKEPLLYALHRFRKASARDESARIPTGFKLNACLDSGELKFGAGNSIRLKAKLDNELAIILSESPLDSSQRIRSKPEGWVLEARLRDSWELRMWILSQGSRITVLGPKVLRTYIHEELERAVLLYR